MSGCIIRCDDLQHSNWIVNTRKNANAHTPVKYYEGSLTQRTQHTNQRKLRMRTHKTKRIFHSAKRKKKIQKKKTKLMFGSKVFINFRPFETKIFALICRHLFFRVMNVFLIFGGLSIALKQRALEETNCNSEENCSFLLHVRPLAVMHIEQFRLFCMTFACLNKINNNAFPLVSLELRHGIVKRMWRVSVPIYRRYLQFCDLNCHNIGATAFARAHTHTRADDFTSSRCDLVWTKKKWKHWWKDETITNTKWQELRIRYLDGNGTFR